MERPVPGSVFGYRIRSDLTFHYLRHAAPGPSLVVEEAPSAEPEGTRILLPGTGPTKPTSGFVDVYSVGDGYAVEVDYAGWFHVDPREPRIVVPSVPETEVGWREPLLWGLPTALCLIERGDLVVHGAAVEIEGRALTFGAPGFYGKSTLSFALAAKGFRVLSEDLTCIGLSSPPVVWPGPAVLRLRKDMAHALGGGTGVRITEDRDKVHLKLDDVGSGDAVPLAGVVLLRESDDVRIEEIGMDRAIPDLWRLGLNIPNDQGRADLLDKTAKLLESISVSNLHRPLTPDSLEATVDRLVSLAQL
ncbi:MAG TPA: hypothetical protein VIL12_06895 [Acidimicrobiia bacterium]